MLGSDRFQFETPNVIDPGDLPPNQPRRAQNATSYSDDRSPTSSTHSNSSSESSQGNGNGNGNGSNINNNNKDVQYHHERNSSARLLNDINDLELSPRGVRGVPLRNNSAGKGKGSRNKIASGGYRDKKEESLRCEYGDMDDDDDEFDDRDHDAIAASLPSVEEARSYAASLLDNAEKKYRNSNNGAINSMQQHASSSNSNNKHSLGLDRTVPIHAGDSSFAALSQHFKRSSNQHHGHHSGSNGNGRHHASKHLVFRRVAVLVAKILLVLILTLTAVLICLALINSKKSSSRNNKSKNAVDDAAFPQPNAFPQPAPTAADNIGTTPANMARLNAVIDYLSAGEITSLHDLTTPGSPQYLAAHWMANVDALRYDVPSHVDDDPDLFVQRYVLATFYYATQGSGGISGGTSGGSAEQGDANSSGSSGSGNGWTDPLKFLSAEHECGWYEREQVIGFIDAAYAVGVTCHGTDTLKVANLFIPSNNLKGSLPSELRHLPELTMLALPMNEIQGPIPEDLQYLSKLDYLDLKYNALDGSVPEFFGSISTLEVLGLSNNKFSGSIPGAWSTLSKLKTFAVDDNVNLNGSLGFANHLVHLEFFYVNGNQFTGTIDDNFLAAATMLKEVDISNNDLTSTSFPVHLLQHPTLSVLDMASNELQGALPEVLPNENEYLEFLSLRNNRLTGSITATNLPMLTALTHLDLQGNGLIGTLPDEMISLSQLTYLFVGHNDFTVPQMPSWIYELSQLRELSMARINMQLGIPVWLESLENLVLLDLSENAMTGKVPPELFQLPSLRFLLLNNNNLSGSLPTAIENVPTLLILSLHKNQIVGDMNHVCSQAPSLQLLGTDCSSSIQCSETCCPACCPPEDDLCFVENIPHFLTWYDGMWEFGYKRASFSYDPAILDESHYFTTLQLQDVSNNGNNTVATPP